MLTPRAATRDESGETHRSDFAAVMVERHDDLASVFGKIDSANSPRVALIAPRGNRELATQLGMRRLQRHLDLAGRDLILVTRSRVLRVRAREERVPTVTSLARVDFDRRGAGVQLGWLTLRLPSVGALLAVGLFVTMVSLGAAVLFFYLPSAQVTVFVPVETIGDTVEIIADTKASDVNVGKGVVPARRREITITRSIPGPATGTIMVPQDRAAVALVFANRTTRPVTVPQGTVVQATGGAAFTLGSDVQLAARIGASGEAVALAQRPGTAGNVPRNTVTRIAGPLSDQVSVTNPSPGEKGTDTPQTVVSDKDVEFLQGLATIYLTDAAKKEILARYAETDTVFGDGAQVNLGDCSPAPPVGQVARYTELTCTATASMLTASNDDLNRIYSDRSRQKIGPDRMLLDNSFRTTIDHPGTFDATFDRLSIAVRFAGLVAPLVDRGGLRAALAGKTRTGAGHEIRTRVDSPIPPVIDLDGWAPWLPRKANRISIDIQPAAQNETEGR